MAVLSEELRQKVRDLFMRGSTTRASFTKPELRAAVDALDDYLDTNAAAINSALPNGFRTKASQKQKALLLMYVVGERYGVT